MFIETNLTVKNENLTKTNSTGMNSVMSPNTHVPALHMGTYS